MSPSFRESHYILSKLPLADLPAVARLSVFPQRYMQQQCCLFCSDDKLLLLNCLLIYTCCHKLHTYHFQRMTITLNLLLTSMWASGEFFFLVLDKNYTTPGC